MGKVMKRYARIFIEYFIIALLALLLSGIIQSAMAARSEFRAAVSNNAVAVTVQDSHAAMSEICRALMADSECTAIYKVFPYANASAVWNRSAAINRPMMSGSFFSAEQLQSSERYAVVGKNTYEKQAKMEGETPVVYFDTMPYTVIGVLGYANRTSDYDDAFYINLSSLWTEGKDAADGEYIIDYASKADFRYESILTRWTPYLHDEAKITQIALNKYIPSVTDVLSDDSVIEFLLISLLMVLVSSFSVTLEWIERRKSEIAIRKQLGATTWEMLRYIVARMLIISVIAYVVAYPLYGAEHANIMRRLNYNASTMNAAYSAAVYAICILISLLGCIPAGTAVRKILPQALAR